MESSVPRRHPLTATLVVAIFLSIQGCAFERTVDSFGNYTVDVINQTDLDLSFTYTFQTPSQTNEVIQKVRAHDHHPVNTHG